MQGAAKVGFLVVVFAILLYGGYAVLGRALLREKTVTYYADFADAGGTNRGTLVTMAGVKIGTVPEIELISPTKARMTITISEEVKVPRGSVAKISGSLIGIGGNPIEIVPPAGATNGYVAAGETIPGVRSSAMEGLLPDTKETFKELNLTLAATRKLIENKELQAKLEKVLDTSSATLAKFGTMADNAQGLMAKANGIVDQNQAAMANAMRNASLAMSDVRKSTLLITKLIESGKYQKETLALLKQLNATATKADDLMVGINNFVLDSKMQGDLKESVANVNKMTDSGTRIAANTEEISKNGIILSQKAIELTDKANAIAEEAKAAFEKISGFFTRGSGKPAIPKAEAHLDLTRQSNPGHWRTDLWGRLDTGKGFVDVGLYDAFESNKAILQMGEPLGKSADYRYGIFASKPGVGVDFRVAPRVSLRSDLFDINNPHFDVRAHLDFGNGFVGWLGLERIFDRNSFVVGVGIKK
jgi:phospholipid/cholesterol/gamma-HCH transport system substrate-binding protein